jgi:hypothetical protein
MPVGAEDSVCVVLEPGVVGHVSATVMLAGPGPIADPLNDDEHVLKLDADTVHVPTCFGAPAPAA